MGCLKIKYDPVGKTLAKKWKIFERGLEKKGVTIFFYVKTYRYGFNGMEKDDEVKGQGNSYTTHFRQYDPRIARWLSLDPAMKKHPNQSPYAAYNNNPLFYTDPLGDDPPEKEKKEIKKSFINAINQRVQQDAEKEFNSSISSYETDDDYSTEVNVKVGVERKEISKTVELLGGAHERKFEGEFSLDNENDIKASDYYPFGMEMPGRKYASESYRYDYQGQVCRERRRNRLAQL